MGISGIGSIASYDCKYINNEIAIRGVSGLVENSLFTKNTYGITDAFGVHLKNINITGSKIACDIGSDCIIENSIIDSNETGVAISSSLSFSSKYPLVFKNKICDNFNYHVYNGSNINLNIGTNCFCEKDSASIENKLFDGYDDITKGLFNYSIYSQDCSTAIQTIIKVPDNLGLEEKKREKNIILFPNPSHDFISIQSSSTPLQCRLYDAIGNEVLCSCSNGVIDIHNLASGYYLLSILFKDRIVNTMIQKY